MRFEAVKFKGLKAIRVRTARLELVVLEEWGPRIVHLSKPGGRNLLFVDDVGRGRGDWRLGGGHRVWTWRPGADECEETYADDNAPCSVARTPGRAPSLHVMGAEHPRFRISRGLIFRTAPGGAIDVVNVVRNASDLLWSGGVWALTCTDPAGKSYAFPLGGADKAWNSFTMHVPLAWAGHSSRLDDPQLRWLAGGGDNLLVIRPQGVEAKRMLSIEQGWMACSAPRQGCAFFKLFPFNRTCPDRYPFLCNAAFYIGPDNFMVELETMSTWVTLRPGESVEHVERWALTAAVDFEKPGAARRARSLLRGL